MAKESKDFALASLLYPHLKGRDLQFEMHRAAKSGDAKVVQELAPSHAQSIWPGGTTPLIAALEARRWNCAKLLAPHSDIYAEFHGVPAWILAAQHGDLETLKACLARLRCVAPEEQASALEIATKSAHVECALAIAAKFPEARVRASTLIDLCDWSGSRRFAEMLPYVDPSEIGFHDQLGKSLLMCAAEIGLTHAVSSLLPNSDPNRFDDSIVDGHCRNALMLAMENGHQDCVKLLVGSTDLDGFNDDSETPKTFMGDEGLAMINQALAEIERDALISTVAAPTEDRPRRATRI